MSPVTWSFEEAKVLKVKVKFPLHRSPPKKIVPAKQPIMKCRPKEEHLPETKQTNIYMQAMIQWVSTSIDYLISMYNQLQQ
jgi:hypothetical protein